jgi:uncharacterized membrane protein YphA (DoxX/SURF4 family)
LLLRVIAGGIFLYAGAMKLRQPFSFLEAIYRYELATRGTAIALAVVIPWLEIIVGACLLSNLLIRGSTLLAGIMSLGFVVAQIYAVAQGLTIDCGCFGSSHGSPNTVGAVSIAKTLLLCIASWLAFVLTVSRPHSYPNSEV